MGALFSLVSFFSLILSASSSGFFYCLAEKILDPFLFIFRQSVTISMALSFQRGFFKPVGIFTRWRSNRHTITTMCVCIVSLSYITLKAHHPHGRVWISDQKKKQGREKSKRHIVSSLFLFYFFVLILWYAVTSSSSRQPVSCRYFSHRRKSISFLVDLIFFFLPTGREPYR